MDEDTRSFCIRRTTRIISRILGLGIPYPQSADCCVVACLLDDDVSSYCIEIYHPVSMVPEHVSWGFRTVRYNTRYVDFASHTNVQVLSAQDFRFWNCKSWKKLIIVFK